MPRFDITIAGELNLDLILYGLPEQLPPERELLADRMMLTLGSSSAICAHNLAAMGSRVGFISRIGDDSMGELARARLAESGVDTSKVRVTKGDPKTGLSVILQRADWRNIVTYAGTIFQLRLEDLDLDYLADSRHFHLSSFYLQRGLQADVAELFRRMKAAGLSTSLDTNDDPDDRWEGGLTEVLRHVDVLMPNEREACRMAKTEDLDAAVTRLAELVPLVVVKTGSKGCVAQRKRERIEARAVQATFVDPVGAGDSFDAGFLSHYVRGDDLKTCLRWGNVAGAFSTTQAGGTEAFRDRKALDDFFLRHASSTL